LKWFGRSRRHCRSHAITPANIITPARHQYAIGQSTATMLPAAEIERRQLSFSLRLR